MNIGIERIDRRIKILQQGGTIPIQERGHIEHRHLVFGFSPAETYSYDVWEDVTHTRIDQNGTLHRQANLRKPLNTSCWIE